MSLVSRSSRSFTALVLATALTACGGSGSGGASDPVSDPAPSDPAASDPSGAAAPRPPVMPTDAEAQRFSRASNAFAFDLWARLRDRPGNLAVSPASISIALAMTAGGARTRTAEQMQQVLHIDDLDAFHTSASHVLTSWNADSGVTLRVANRLFGERTYAFEPAFVALTRDRYEAPLEPLDFRGAFEPSRQRINGWVAEQTEDRIRDLIPAGGLDATTRLVLTNAVYFLARWQHEFEHEATFDAPFHRPGGDVRAPTMHQRNVFGYHHGDGVAVLELPYVGERYSMLVLLPDEAQGLAALEAGLTSERLDGWTAQLTPTELDVALPRARIAPATSLELATILTEMGMPDAFSASEADFFGIATPPDPRMRLYIAKVFHKAFVEIDERGTEAAAATAVVMAEGGGMPRPVPTFVADHPYLFVLRDRSSGAVLFIGRVVDPTDGGA